MKPTSKEARKMRVSASTRKELSGIFKWGKTNKKFCESFKELRLIHTKKKEKVSQQTKKKPINIVAFCTCNRAAG